MHAQVWEPLVKTASVLSLGREFRLPVTKDSRVVRLWRAAPLLPVTSLSSQQNVGFRVIRPGFWRLCHLQAVQPWGGVMVHLSEPQFLP